MQFLSCTVGTLRDSTTITLTSQMGKLRHRQVEEPMSLGLQSGALGLKLSHLTTRLFLGEMFQLQSSSAYAFIKQGRKTRPWQ